MKPRILLLFSAGKESLLNLHILSKTHKVHLLYIQYGNKSSSKELKSARYYSTKYLAPLHVHRVQLPTLPEGISKGIRKKSNVPFRNLVFLSIAANIAKGLGIRQISFGAVKTTEEIKTSKYTDTGISFYSDVQELFSKFGIKVFSPSSFRFANDILEYLDDYVDVSRLWMCDTSDKKPCGKCSKCVSTLKASGLSDKSKQLLTRYGLHFKER